MSLIRPDWFPFPLRQNPMHTMPNPSPSHPAPQADIVLESFASSDVARVVRKGSPAPKKAAGKKTAKKAPVKKKAAAKPAAKKAAKKTTKAASATTKKAAPKSSAKKTVGRKTTKKAAKQTANAAPSKPTPAAAKPAKPTTKAGKKPAARREGRPAAEERILPASTPISAITDHVDHGDHGSVVDFDRRPRNDHSRESGRVAPASGRANAEMKRDRQPEPRENARPDPRRQPAIAKDSAPAAQTPRTPPAPSPPPPHVEEPADEVLPGPHGREQIFEQATTFADLGLRKEVLRGIEEAGFKHPTTIQAKLIPEILTGQDVLGQAKTGTGKTAAFGLPMLHALKPEDGAFQGLILVPTRELAIQVDNDLKKLGKHARIRSMPVYGGQNIRTQAERLAKRPEIIVATPGRIMDMAQRGYVHYNNVRMVVLDEVDRMLDIGFRDDIRRILSSCPKHPKRQTIFVSATISGDIEKLAHSHAHNAKKVIASAGSLTVAMVKQFYMPVERWDKRRLLLHVLKHEDPALTVIFCRMKRTVDDVAKYLAAKGIDVHAIHGDMYQSSRNKVIEKLRAGDLSVLVASDLAARGIDVEGITHVINYDLPEDPDIYVHRIGRTARAGRDGVAWSFVTPEQGELLTEIELLINAEIPKLDYPDFQPGPVPQDIQAARHADTQRRAQTKVYNRYAQSAPAAALQSHAGAADAAPDHARFPGGVVPTKLPPRMLQGRVKTARSLKQAMRPSVAPPAVAPTTPPHRPHTP